MSLFGRKSNIIIFHVLVVLFINVWIKYTNNLILTDSCSFFTEKYSPYAFPEYTKCGPNSPSCLTIGYIMFTDNETDPVQPWIAKAITDLETKLNITESKMLYKGADFKKIESCYDQYTDIKSIVLFCNKHDFVSNVSMSFGCDGLKMGTIGGIDLNIFGLIYNQSGIAPNLLKDPNTPQKIDKNMLLLKKTIDESIINFNRAETGKTEEEKEEFKYDFQLSSFPKPKLDMFKDFDSLTMWSSFHYMFMILLSFTQFIKIISQEKTMSLRKGLEPYGLSAFSYWASWLIFALTLNFFFTAVITLVGYLFNAITFVKIPIYLSSLLIFTTLNTYSVLAILITTICPDYRTASKVAYTIFIFSIFLQIFFCQNGISNIFFLSDRPTYVVVAQWVLSIIPSFHFTIVCNNMHYQAGSHLDILTMGFVRGPGYDFTTYVNGFQRDQPMIGRMSRFADVYFQLMILILTAIFGILAVIFDHKIESNRGHKAKFFKWRRSEQSIVSENEQNESLVSNEANGIFEVRNISKVFRNPFRKEQNFKALDKVNINIRRNETIALLGENGAGKSTLISILTGVIDRTEGEIVYDGKAFNPQNHQKLLISVCPQYDLLWHDLTVYENLFIIGEFKGISPQQIHKDIKEILASLNLKDQKNTLVRNLSGGMRRRASVGMALLGSSELVIFDEPTTGLDPVNRKAVWNFIELLKKKGKTILLTTHIMDEADFLADRIAIINKGRILKVDRSIDIKNEFQKVNVILSLRNYSVEFAEELKEYFQLNFPGAHELKYSSEKRIKYNVKNEIGNLKKLVKDFEGDGEMSDHSRMFENYIDSFEIAVLDLEEAYILVNEESEKEEPK